MNIITQIKSFKEKVNESSLKISTAVITGMILPTSTFAADSTSSTTDFSKISHPLILLGKLIALGMGLIYLIIGAMWIWLPGVVALWTKKHYDKKFEERGEENSKEMLQKMLFGMLGAAILSFIVIGALGMTFFGANSLIGGVKAYYGGLLVSLQKFMLNNLGLNK